MKPQHHLSVTVYVHGVEVIVNNVTVHPYIPATQIDPPEEPFVEFDEVFIGDHEVNELFYGKQLDELNAAILNHLEE